MKKSLSHICIFLPTLAGGGAERMMLHLAEGFQERGVKVDFIVAQAKGDYTELYNSKVQLIDLKVNRVLWAIPKLVRYIRREHPNALLTTLDHANIAALLAKKIAGVSTRVVIREANTLSKVTNNAKTFKEKWLPLLIKWLYKNADGIVSVSAGVAKDLENFVKLPPEKSYVIYNPVVNSELLMLSAEPNGHPWFSANMPPVILGVGRLTKQKDFPTLIKSFALLREVMQAKLIILGEGEERSNLEKLCAELGVKEDVDLPGFVQNPFSFMSKANLFVLSSTWEGLPGALIQALACGCSVVSTDCPSGPNEILNEGTFGRLVPTGNKNIMAEAMIQVIQNPYPKDKLRGRASQFSGAKILDQYLEVLLPSAYSQALLEN